MLAVWQSRVKQVGTQEWVRASRAVRSCRVPVVGLIWWHWVRHWNAVAGLCFWGGRWGSGHVY